MVSKIILFYSIGWLKVGRKYLTNRQLPILRAGQRGARRIRKVLGIKQLLPTFRRAGSDKL